ncbi:MAG TPA: hypothetical protein VNM92_05625 [Thermoanaerobaculia bacterium]|nr:hypothetical protein [Thermoanaerobaculia bacterium]
MDVDLGTESLKVFIPKISPARHLSAWAAGLPAVVLILTVAPRRISAMERLIAEESHSVGVIVLPLPKSNGRAAVRDLAAMLAEILD